MRRTGDRILGNSFGGSEKPRDKIAIASRRGHDERKTVDGRQLLHIRLQREDLIFGVEHAEIIARAQNLFRLHAQRFD